MSFLRGLLCGICIAVFSIILVTSRQRDELRTTVTACRIVIDSERDMRRNYMVDLHLENDQYWPPGWLEHSVQENDWQIYLQDRNCRSPY